MSHFESFFKFIFRKTKQTDNAGSPTDSPSCKKHEIEDQHAETSKTKDLTDPEDNEHKMDQSLKR